MITSDEIKKRLWDGANELRGSMDASRYKDYMLGLMFYKFLSDKTLQAFVNVTKTDKTGAELVEEYFKKVKENDKGEEGLLSNIVFKNINKLQGFFILPEYLYQTWIKDINDGSFELQKIIDSLNDFERRYDSTDDVDDFKGLFKNLDLTDTALGSDLKHRSDNIKELINLFADLDMVELQENDILGDAYEYLIGMFAMESGKKAGEFYTPHFVSEVIAQIVAKDRQITSIYDPTVGSGSLLLTVKKHLSEDNQKELHYYGQEKNTATYNLTRMNLLLHGIRPNKMDIKNGDTLAEDWPEDPSRPGEGVLFDAIVMNPPYSLKNWNKVGLKGIDPRFEFAGGILPPDNKGDYAFLLHGLYHLNNNGGRMGIVLPHGVLFRGAAEGDIRKILIDKDCIDTIISLPAGMFTNTGIPVIIMILKKDRQFNEPILFINAVEDYTKIGKQNVLRERDIAKIVDTYCEKKEIVGYSRLVQKEEIIENDYNLNIPRYVETKDDEIKDDVEAHLLGGIPENDIKNLKALNKLVPELIEDAFVPLRKGYVKMNYTVEQLSEKVKKSKSILDKVSSLNNVISLYSDKYWNRIKEINEGDDREIIGLLKTEMLEEIKSIVLSFGLIDEYSGYQIIADIWKNTLGHDVDVVLNNGFYKAGRMREPNMVVKGSGEKRQLIQEGFVGSIIPNDLIEKEFYSQELNEIKELEYELGEIETSIETFTEYAKDDSNQDYEVLGNCLNNEREKLERKKIKANIKELDKGDSDREILEQCEKLFSDKTVVNKKIKNIKQEINDAVQEKILSLKDEEIDKLLFEKWFGNLQDEMNQLIMTPVNKELESIKLLENKYIETLDCINEQISNLDNDVKDLMEELVVVYE